ncbi:hypothetical protein [Mycolicibacterium psychrotolerans]|nr:hypothetical protein [Mycolicibacterium psychrotolerans]
MSLPEIELSVYSDEGLVECEQLYEDALEALYAAQHAQTVVPDVGYLHSIREAQGATDAESPFADSWAVAGTIRLGVRAPRP